MKKSLLTMAFLGLSACAMPQTRTGVAIITSLKEAGDSTSASQATKRGEACQQNILGIANVGDSSIETAKRNGNIETVSSVDYDILGIAYFYSKACTIVKGN